jgi:hypothetical protein
MSPEKYAHDMRQLALEALARTRHADVRETLGRIVREAWVKWATQRRAEGHEVPDHHLDPWEALSEPNQEVDRQIGVAVAASALEGFAGAILRGPDDAHRIQTALGLGEQDYDVEAQIREIQELRRRAGLPVIPAPTAAERLFAMLDSVPPPTDPYPPATYVRTKGG